MEVFNLDTKTLAIVFLLAIIFMLWFSLKSLEGKIKCQFHRKDRTVIDRTIKITDKEVRFDKGTYQINPRRFSIKWIKVLSIFPLPMLFQEWKWDTDQPLDPSTFKNNPDSPEAMQASSSEKDWKNFNYEGSEKSGVKESGLMKYLPFITLGAVVILGVFMYMKFGDMDFKVRSLGDMIRNIK